MNIDTSARLLKLAATASVITATLLIAAKLAAYLLTDSVSVLASLVDSLMDLGASLVNLVAVRYALQPPDEEHRHGHGKAESLAGLAQGMFIAGSGLFLIVQAIGRLVRPRDLEQTEIGLAVIAFAIVATAVLLAVQHYVIRRTGSVAIRADSLHYRADLLSNAAIIVALLLAEQGLAGADPLFALGIALYILWSAWQIARDAFNHLMDRELPEDQRARIEAIVGDHPEVFGLHQLRTRLAGRTPFIQLDLELNGELSLDRAHAIATEVEQALLEEFPTADITIHQDPVAP